MNRPNNHRRFNLMALALLGVCLGLFMAEIASTWVPGLRREPSLSTRVNRWVGTEFRIFWIGSFMALHGELHDLYTPSKFEEVEKHLSGYSKGHAWLYPPTFLLMVLPLSLIPYLASLAVWLAITLTCYVLVLRRICPQPYLIFWILFFPGIVINFTVGHNGFVSGALLGGGLLLLNSSPVLAGILFGLSFYKPQLAILIPLALLAGRRWKVLAVTAVSAICIALASAVIFGYQAWLGFVHNIPLAEKLTETPWYWAKMPTIYTTARLAGSGTFLAWALQGLVMFGVVAGVYWVWSGNATPATRASILILGILLFTRYAFIYDYAILAIPLAWLWQEGQTAGWLPLEKPLLLYAWFAPVLASVMFKLADWPLGWLMLLATGALFILVLRRYYFELGKVQRATALASL
jgi:hypothetical protein